MKSPKALGLPFADWRPGQRLAIRTCLNPKTTHIVINAPTGSGKSTIAAALPRLDEANRYVTLTATKGLQDQYARTFPYLSDLRGMSNYECLAAKDEFRDWFGVRRTHVTCEDGPCREGAHCELKDSGCLYFDRRKAFVTSNAGLTNYAAWLSNRRYGEGLGQATRLVLDEAHDLPDQLMSAARLEIPTHIISSRVPKTWRDWRRWATAKLDDLPKNVEQEDTRKSRAQLDDTLKKLAMIDETWSWDYQIDSYVFEPTVPRLLMPTLHTFDQASAIIYLSATITPATLSLLDIDTSDVTYEVMKSNFPLPFRPVYLKGRVRVDHRSMQIASDHGAWIDEIDDIIEARLDRNGLIHTVSFDRAYDILKSSRHRQHFVMHHRGQSVAAAIDEFLRRGRVGPAVLLSPSITTGYDFPGRQAEYQIIAKMPFPDTRSRIMQARCDNTSQYREWVTMTRLVQAAGRINRSADDRGETFIVDGHARWFLDQYAYLAPQWFLDAIVKTRRVGRPLPKL